MSQKVTLRKQAVKTKKLARQRKIKQESNQGKKEYIKKEDKDNNEGNSDIYNYQNRSKDEEEEDNDYEDGRYEDDDSVVLDHEGSNDGVDYSSCLDTDDD